MKKKSPKSLRAARSLSAVRAAAFRKGALSVEDFWREEVDELKSNFSKLWTSYNQVCDRLQVVEAGSAPEAPSLWEKIHGEIPDPIEGAHA